ncbi:MAG: Panacea domain-containing protein [Alloprevotella sp.]
MTKLQKLEYIVYGTYLSSTCERLTNEHPQAWPYGPVFPSVRNKLLNKDFSEFTMDLPELKQVKEDQFLMYVVKMVFDTFGERTATYLCRWSHRVGSPWEKTVNQACFEWGDTMSDEWIKDYFDTILKYDEQQR